MKKIVLVIAFTVTVPITVFPQKVPDRRNTITFEPLAILTKTISISYSRKLDEKRELRINPKISFDSQEDNDIGLNPIRDPFWYYNSYSLQIGLSRMLYKSLYIEPMVYYKFATFDNRILMVDNNYYQLLDRTYNGGGLILRSGLKIDKNQFRFNFFYGLGYYLRYYDEEIHAAFGLGAQQISDPIKSNYWQDRLSVHLGIELGYRF